jgi:hypothetical protein
MHQSKKAPWEKFADGEWHTVRDYAEAEDRRESLRQYENYYMSARHWATRNGYRVQVSRRDNGRIIRVKFHPVEGFVRRPTLAEAVTLLEYAMHLRQHGERAPGGNETWREFDMRTEAFLRRTMGLDEEAQ